MKTLWIAVLSGLLARLAFSAPCNSDCTFKRGDVNCNGTVDASDLVILYQGSSYYVVNSDAADVNDDGVVSMGPSGADTVALGSYLYSGGAAPACPGPTTAGLDCTSDSLETCCSPPSSLGVTQFDCSVSSTGNWDFQTESDYMNGSVCVGRTIFYNSDNANCSQQGTEGNMDFLIPVSDVPGFTKKRLQNQVQKAYLNVIVEATFENDIVCDDDNCTDTNMMYVDGQYMDVKVLTRKKGGGSYDTYFAPWWENGDLDYTYFHAAIGDPPVCVVDTNDEAYQIFGTTEPIDITADLAAMPIYECEVWEVYQMEVNDLEAVFTRLGQDHVSDLDKVQVEVQAWVSYEWCECE